MTTVTAPNVANIAIEGTFDDCQDMVKAMFADAPFRQEMHLSAMNSINWGRIAAQVPYYVAAALTLGAPDREVAFSVPTGNFGNVLSAWVARRMGLPIARLIIGSNRNDILARFLASNDMSVATVEPSLSPSMDIQVSSNFERMLFELLDRDPAATATAMSDFRRTGKMPVPDGAWHRCRTLFHGFRLDDAGTERRSRGCTSDRLYRRPPHRHRRCRRTRESSRATACRSSQWQRRTRRSFPTSSSVPPASILPLPPRLADLFERPERFTVLPNDLAAVETQVRALARRNAC